MPERRALARAGLHARTSAPGEKEASMPRDGSKEVKVETMGSGVFNPGDFYDFSPDEPMIMGVYRDGVDLRHVTIRNFEPGQVTELHTHPENAHCIYIIEGSGIYLREDMEVPIEAGQFIIVPRGMPHGLRNTGGTRLSYLGVNAGPEPAAGG
jgi:mannose-6-phosphate isomerase-like protein (cupin superfamily)